MSESEKQQPAVLFKRLLIFFLRHSRPYASGHEGETQGRGTM